MKTKIALLIASLLYTALNVSACGIDGCKSSGISGIAGVGLIGLLLCCGAPILFFLVYEIYTNSKNKK